MKKFDVSVKIVYIASYEDIEANSIDEAEEIAREKAHNLIDNDIWEEVETEIEDSWEVEEDEISG